MLLSFSGIPRPVRLTGCAELVPVIRDILRGWSIEEVGGDAVSAADIVIERTDGGYRRSSPWLHRRAVFAHPVDAVCDFLVDLMKAYVGANRGLLCLHGAAALFGDGLVIFPSTYKAGKSTLAACLARSGVRLFSDDVLPIVAASGHGMAPGLLPRVRLPVPGDAAPGLADFVTSCAGPQSGRYCYLDLDDSVLAPLGETAAIRGAVVLERDSDCNSDCNSSRPPALTPAGVGEILQSTVARNFAHNMAGIATLDRLHAVIEGAQCFRLSYRTAGEAAAMLIDTFGAPARRRRTA